MRLRCNFAFASIVASLCLIALGTVGCEPDLDTTRDALDAGTFGQIVYAESCQRVAWTSQLDEGRVTLDVSAAIYGPVCDDGAPPPADAPPRLVALTGQRSALVAVVDAVLPQPFLSSLERFLEAIAALADDGTTTAMIDASGALLARLADDDGLTAALARVSGREGLRPAAVAAGLPHAILAFPSLDDLLDDVFALLLDGSGQPVAELSTLLDTLAHEMTGAQPVSDAADPERTLALSLSLLFAPAAEVAPPGATPSLLAVRDARGEPTPTPDENGHVPPPFVDADKDGQADVDAHGRLVGAPALPFVPPGESDAPHVKRDGAGRLVTGSGTPIYAYRDLEGTVLAGLVRELGVLADPSRDDLLGLVFGATGMLGPRVAKTKSYTPPAGVVATPLTYEAFDVSSSALLDLAHAFIQLLGAPRARDLLLAARTLLGTYESPTARLLGAMLDANARGKSDASAHIPEQSTLYDELAPIIVRVLSVPGLASDVLAALTDPHVKGLGPMIALQMSDASRFVLDQDQLTVHGAWGTPVDRAKPEGGWNRSVLERMLHLVHDANGVEFCNKEGATLTFGITLKTYHRCEMFRVADLGLFFGFTIVSQAIKDDPSRYATTRSQASFREQIVDDLLKTLPLVGISDDSSGDATIQTLVGIPGFGRFPTPEAAARSLFLDHDHESSFLQDTIDPVTCADGETFIDSHNESIFAWEQPLANNPSGFAGDDFYDAVRPVLDAFAKHDECAAFDENGACTSYRNALKIFLDLLAVLHEHWASPGATYATESGPDRPFTQAKGQPRYTTGDGAVTYEPVLADVLGPGDLVPSLIALAPTLLTMTLDGTKATPPALDVLLAAASYVFDPKATPPSLAYRDGATSTTWNDGTTPVPRATLYYLIADAEEAKRAQLAAAPDRGAAWAAATSDLVDEALTVEEPQPGTFRLRNRRLHGVTLALVDFLRARLAVHGVLGDSDDWVRTQLTQDLTDTLTGPTFAAAADLVARIESDPSTVQRLGALVQSIAGETSTDASPPPFAATLTTAGDLLQALLDDANLLPIARGVAKVLDPSTLAPVLAFMKRGRALDPSKPLASDDDTKRTTLVTILGNLFAPPQPAQATPMSRLADSLSQVNRADPTQQGDLDAADYRAILAQVRDFLVDEDRGFARFVAIVQSRRAP